MSIKAVPNPPQFMKGVALQCLKTALSPAGSQLTEWGFFNLRHLSFEMAVLRPKHAWGFDSFMISSLVFLADQDARKLMLLISTRLMRGLILGLSLAVINGLALPSMLESASARAQAFECGDSAKVPPHKEIITSVEKQYSEFAGLTAEFEQESYFLGLGKEVKSKGNVAFKKPGMMDWLYESPERQRFVTDGRTLWYYQPAENQVTLADFKNSFNSDLPVSFLLGVGSLSDNFNLSSACYSTIGLVLKLTPKVPDPNLSEFLLLVDRKSYLPTGAKVVDAAGNETKITFANIKLDGALPDTRFTFEIPKGADQIDQRGRETAKAGT